MLGLGIGLEYPNQLFPPSNGCPSIGDTYQGGIVFYSNSLQGCNCSGFSGANFTLNYNWSNTSSTSNIGVIFFVGLSPCNTVNIKFNGVSISQFPLTNGIAQNYTSGHFSFPEPTAAELAAAPNNVIVVTIQITDNCNQQYLSLNSAWPIVGSSVYHSGTSSSTGITGCGGLVAAPLDIDIAITSGAEWGCQGTSISTGTAIGTGTQNTINMLAGCSQTTPTTGAILVSNLTTGGYTDWFLPSLNELKEMYTALHANGLGSFYDVVYESSSEYDADNFHTHQFNNDFSYYWYKENQYPRVRAIREF